MKNKNLVLLFLLLMVEGWLLSAAAQSKSSVYKPWSHGQLKVSKENRYLMNADGTPFFWLGDTGWLLPEKLNRDEAAYYLEHVSIRPRACFFPLFSFLPLWLHYNLNPLCVQY